MRARALLSFARAFFAAYVERRDSVYAPAAPRLQAVVDSALI